MSTIRFPEPVWTAARHHLFGKAGEHFAFFFANWSTSQGRPIMQVDDVFLVPDDEVTSTWHGMKVSTEALLNAINSAVKGGYCLIEAHNHGGQAPRFSRTDRKGLQDFPGYVHDSIPGKPYAATVWGDTTVYGEYFLPDGRHGLVDSITVVGGQLRQIVSRDDDNGMVNSTFSRQLPWFTSQGQLELGRIRVGIVGCGGTGAHVIQQLVFLGCRNFVLVDHDAVDTTNMNRLVTATAADLGTPKVILGRRTVRSVAPQASVLAIEETLQSRVAIDALKGVDVVFGCVDNDGARLVLNELALAYMLPYIDLAVGITAQSGKVSLAGGRVAVVLPGGPCLQCMGEIDPREAAHFLSSASERAEQVERGYVSGMDVAAPAVVSLNGAIAAIAVNEFAMLVSGTRSVNTSTHYDLLGSGRPVKSQWLVPMKHHQNSACVQCTVTNLGDEARVERYADSVRQGNAGAAPMQNETEAHHGSPRLYNASIE